MVGEIEGGQGAEGVEMFYGFTRDIQSEIELGITHQPKQDKAVLYKMATIGRFWGKKEVIVNHIHLLTPLQSHSIGQYTPVLSFSQTQQSQLSSSSAHNHLNML